MLDPHDRAALTRLLQPPAGFRLSHAVGTTFTLDLDTALTVPLSFASRRVSADDDSIGILDAVRRAADRVDIFAQAGYVSIAMPPSDLVAFLEPMVHPVTMTSGLFHPKVWFLEFERDDDRVYRFLCASRNLTNDTSWDVVITLEGAIAAPEKRGAARSINAPLVDLLKWLPRHTVLPLEKNRERRLSALADRWSGIEWEAPPDMRDIAFHVWGIGRKIKPDFSGQNALLISPFLSEVGVDTFMARVGKGRRIVSRPESIDPLEATLGGNSRPTYWVLNDAASLEAEKHGHEDSGAPSPRSALRGLHAKTFIVDRQKRARIFVGSLNATRSAFHQNVEVMVEVEGGKTKHGVDATMSALGNLLEPYEHHTATEPDDNDRLDRDLSKTLARVAGIPLHARVVTGDPFALKFWSEDDAPLPPDVELSWRPLSRPGLSIPGLPPSNGEQTTVDDLALRDITPFILISARDARGERFEQRAVVIAQLHDDPEDRRDAIIAAHLTDRSSFLRFLMLLLELGETAFGAGGAGGSWGTSRSDRTAGTGLFEALMKAVGRGQAGLDDVERVVRMIQRDEQSSALPDGFTELWDAAWIAHQQLTGSTNVQG